MSSSHGACRRPSMHSPGPVSEAAAPAVSSEIRPRFPWGTTSYCLSPAPHAVPHAAGFSAGLSPAPHAVPHAASFSAGLSPAPHAVPHAAGFSAGLSPAPHAVPHAAALSAADFLDHPKRFESAILFSSFMHSVSLPLSVPLFSEKTARLTSTHLFIT